MPAHILAAALQGIEALPVDIEVDVLAGLPSFTVVGLIDRAIAESRERMVSALTNCGYTPPRRKTIVSLAPASLKKEGSLYDVPIALGFLIASEQIKFSQAIDTRKTWFIGELGLDGAIRPVRGVLPIVLAAKAAGARELYIPAGNTPEAAAVADQLTIFAVKNLPELIAHLAGTTVLQPVAAMDFPRLPPEPEIDFADIKGQEHAKRALLVAASAGHNVLPLGAQYNKQQFVRIELVRAIPKPDHTYYHHHENGRLCAACASKKGISYKGMANKSAEA